MGEVQRDARFDEIAATVAARMADDPQKIRDMIAVRDRYNGDWVVPVPEVEGSDVPSTVSIVADTIDQTAMRAGDLDPFVECPAVVPEHGRMGPKWTEYAAIRRRAHYARWDYSAMPLLKNRFLRHLVAYGTGAMAVVPDFEDRRARIVLRDPLAAYPEPRDPEDVRRPRDVAFIYGRSAAWLRKQYPQSAAAIDKFAGTGDQMWNVFEWVDEDEIIIGLLGPRLTGQRMPTGVNAMELTVPLRRWPNRAGMCTAYVPRRVTLDRVMGQVAKMLPVEDLWSKLYRLDVFAAEKAIMNDMYAIADGNDTPQIVSGDGNWQPGTTGNINLVKGAKAIGVLNAGPGPIAQHIIREQERHVRQGTGSIAEFAGEISGASPRTGRAINAATSFAIDPRIRELHLLTQYTLKAVNETGMAVEEGYWPRRKYVVFSGWSVDKGVVRYTPAEHFQSADGGRNNAVSYPFPGLDAAQTAVAVAQRTGARLMSKKIGRIKDPMIEDAEAEEQQIVVETMQDAFLQASAQQLAGGQMALTDAAEIIEELQAGGSIVEVVKKIDQRRREEAEKAAAEAAAAEGAGVPGGLQPASPVEQARAAARAEEATSPVPELPTGMSRLRELHNAVRAVR